MTEYSGRTSAYAHKRKDWREQDISDVPSAISQMTVFNAQWTDCPVEVEDEVKKLWQDMELDNNVCYYAWDRDSEYYVEESDAGEEPKFADVYPLIDEYLMSKGITQCLIHWWW